MSLSDFEGDAGHPLAAHPRLVKERAYARAAVDAATAQLAADAAVKRVAARDRFRRAARAEIRAGDWMCPKGCGNVFASKMRCFRCGAPKPQGALRHAPAEAHAYYARGGGAHGGGWGDGRRPTMGGGGRW